MSDRDELMASTALYNSLIKYEVNFGERVFIIRRNLLFLTVVSICSLFIKPGDNGFELSLGLKGDVPPLVVYLGLFLAVGYQAYYFVINCSQAIGNRVNHNGVQKVYFFELALRHAEDNWRALVKEHAIAVDNHTTSDQGLILSFTVINSNRTDTGHWNVTANVNDTYIQKQDLLIDAIKQGDCWELTMAHSQRQIQYYYKATGGHHEYLASHKIQWWLTKKKLILEHQLPLVLAVIALFLLGLKLLTLVPWKSLFSFLGINL